MFVVAATDSSWFHYLKLNHFIDQVNFWSPGSMSFKALKPGEHLVFKLKGSEDLAGGYGVFEEYKYQSLDETWNEFGRRNGFDRKEDFVKVIEDYKKKMDIQTDTNECGCIILSDVVFWDNPVKLSDYGIVFKKSTVRYAKYDAPFPFAEATSRQNGFSLVNTTKKKKASHTVTEREGQGQFHAEVCVAYGHKCCISGERTPELLQAAHIQDYINKDSNHIQNGLLLRVDLHTLFDNGLLFIDDNYMVHVSPLVTSQEYRKYDGKIIALPKDTSAWPSQEALRLKENSFRQ